MNSIFRILGAFLVVMLFLVSRSEAATVQYLLNQSNTLADNVDYLLVTILDTGENRLDFQVETLPALNEKAQDNFGIAAFGFLLGSDADVTVNDFLIPDKWKVQFNKGMSEAGNFDVRLLGTGNTRHDPLKFSVLGLDFDDILPGFAAHVAGFSSAVDGYSVAALSSPIAVISGAVAKFENTGTASSAFFYGDSLVTVPVPAALWLFGSGVLFLGRLSTRRRI